MIRLLPLLALAWAAAPSAQITYGDPIPQASASFATDGGSSTSLGAASGSAGLVVVFWSTACPWADRYTPRLADLATRYTRAGVGFVLVDSGAAAVAERQTPAGEAPASARLAVPTLTDTGGALAAAFGAKSTPHAFFFGPDGTLRYDGTIDDSPASADRVRTPYLAQAMDQSIAGIPVEVQRTQAFGCTIKRSTP